MVANFLGIPHKIVDIPATNTEEFYEGLVGANGILDPWDHPRFNIWSWWLAKEAVKDGMQTVYIGEGGDEIFGGYNDRDYRTAWGDHQQYVIHAFKKIQQYFGLNLIMPYRDLHDYLLFPNGGKRQSHQPGQYAPDWNNLFQYYGPPTKKYLREAYKDVLPGWMLENNSQPPAFVKRYTESEKSTKADLQLLAVKAWLEAQYGITIPDKD